MQELSLQGSQKKTPPNPKMGQDVAMEKQGCIPKGLIDRRVKHGEN